MSSRLHTLRAQSGSALVEVLIGTLVLALATSAVLGGLDGAQDTGLRNKNRSVAATLAQQDLERMRSMPPTVLANYEEVRAVTVGPATYTVASSTDWVVDASGLVSCTSEDTEAEYLRLRSTVTAPADASTPVVADSLLTPALGTFADDTGTAAVKLTDRDGEPLAGVGVTLTGAGTPVAGTTNELGCAIFAFVDAGTWTAEVGGSLVGWDCSLPTQSPVTVAEGKTSLTQIELDQPASARALFETPGEVPALWHSIGVVNAKLPSGVRHFAGATASTSKDADCLFPFADGYGVYATTCEDDGGEPLCCEASNPAVWDGDYFQESGKGYVELDPGEALRPVDVVVPTLHLTVTRAGGASFTGVRVTVAQRDGGYDSEPGSDECSSTVVDTTASGPSGTTAYQFDIPVPFGNYRVCATYDGKRRRTGSSGAPDDPDLTGDPLEQAIALEIPTSGGNGGCP